MIIVLSRISLLLISVNNKHPSTCQFQMKHLFQECSSEFLRSREIKTTLLLLLNQLAYPYLSRLNLLFMRKSPT